VGSRGPIGHGAGHRKTNVVRIDGMTGPVEVPKAPTGLAAPIRKAWFAYWASDVARVADEVDLPALTRLWRLYDDHHRTTAEMRKSERTVAGSKGQDRLHPLLTHLSRLEVSISRLEGQFGLTPASRLRLGIILGRAQLTAQQLNAETRRRARENPDRELLQLMEEMGFEPADDYGDEEDG
jgi:P27 family predicted phage terminase small subunit